MPNKLIQIALQLPLLFLIACTATNRAPAPTATPPPTATLAPLRVEEVEHSVELIISIQFDQQGNLFYANQDGQINYKDGAAQGETILDIPVTRVGFEDGLLGFVLAPDFDSSGDFYTYHIAPDSDGKPLRGEINRYRWANGRVSAPTLIFETPTYPKQEYHFGGGLQFGPDGRLYLILGDTNQPFLARTAYYLPGSILRFEVDGSIPADNPFGPDSAVYATGFRNGFGLAWDPNTGNLYQAENGNSCDDELNLIRPGAHYGWGNHTYDTCPYPDDVGEPPLYQWDTPAAPSVMLFYTADLIPEFQQKLLICAINQNKIYLADVTNPDGMTPLEIDGRDWFCQAALTQAPDGWLYTSVDGKIWRIGR